MSIHTHIQGTGMRRSAVAAAIAVVLVGLAPTGLATARSSDSASNALRLHPKPAGGCGTSGCRHV